VDGTAAVAFLVDRLASLDGPASRARPAVR
jgi:hypothetical protein